MLIIVYNFQSDSHFLFRLSLKGNPGQCRIKDELSQNYCYDTIINRRLFYKTLINQMQLDGIDIKEPDENDVPNTVHNWIIKAFEENRRQVYLLKTNLDFIRTKNKNKFLSYFSKSLFPRK